jgi:hypothetical protein
LGVAANKMKTFARHILLLTLLVTVNSAQAVNYYWVRTTVGNWNSPNSWSLTSGGPPLGAPYPTTLGDVAIFDGGGIGNCVITALVNINATTINATYPGVINNAGVVHACTGNFTIGGGTYNLNNGGFPIQGSFAQTGGTFNGNSGSMQVLGNFTKGAGTFNSTIGPLDVRGNFTVGVNQFNHNNGTVIFGATTSNINIVAPLFNVNFFGFVNSAYTITGTLTVNGVLRYQGTGGLVMNGGNINCIGNVLLTNTSTSGGGTANLRMTGTGAQQFSSSVPAGQSRLPNIIIAKTAGTFGFSGTVTVARNVLYDPPGTTGCMVSHPAGAVLAMCGASAMLTTYDAGVTAGNPILTLCDLTVMTSAMVTLGSYTEVRNLLLQSLSVLDVSASNHTLILSGNWNNMNTTTASFNERQGTVQMITGTITSAVIGGESFYTFRMENPAGGCTVTLNSRINIIYTLADYMTTAPNVMYTTSINILVFLDDATLQFSDYQWMTLVVIGPILKIGDDNFCFPVGAIMNGSPRSRPISITAPYLPTDVIRAQYFPSNSNAFWSHSLRDPSLITMSQCEYWVLNQSVGACLTWVSLSWWNGATPSCQVTSPMHLRVTCWNGSLWKNAGMSGWSGNANNGTLSTLLPEDPNTVFTLASVNAINTLPVEITSFSATAENNHAKLDWTTASETNNDYFVVERSQDGVEIESLDTIDGNGTTSETHDYTSVDESPLDGLSYYRIKQVDFNGEYSHSDWRSIEMQPLDHISMYPNPCNGEVHFNLTGDNEVLWTMTVTNLSGQIVVERTGPKDEFRNVFLDLTAGTYFLQIVSISATYSQKLIIAD